MNTINETSRKVQPAPLRVSRVFSAPRETVFKAWSSADHVKRWFCPNGYSVPEATVEMRVGGRFEVCMRSPEGLEHWTKGTFTEVVAPERLTIDHHVIDPCGGGPLFSAVTQVKFSAAHGGTLMEVVQTYTVADMAKVEPMLKGAPEGWRQTLDKLEAEVARIQSERRRLIGCSRRLPYRAHLRCDDGASVQGAIRRGRQEPLVLRTRRVAADRTHDGLPGRRARAGQGRLRWRRDDDVRRDLPRCRSARDGSSTPTRCVSTTGRFLFRSRRSRSSPQARDGRSSRFASRARFSTATTMPAHANAGRRGLLDQLGASLSA